MTQKTRRDASTARSNKTEDTLVLPAMFMSLDEPFTELSGFSGFEGLTGLSELTGLVELTELVLVLVCLTQVSANTLSSGVVRAFG